MQKTFPITVAFIAITSTVNASVCPSLNNSPCQDQPGCDLLNGNCTALNEFVGCEDLIVPDVCRKSDLCVEIDADCIDHDYWVDQTCNTFTTKDKCNGSPECIFGSDSCYNIQNVENDGCTAITDLTLCNKINGCFRHNSKCHVGQDTSDLECSLLSNSVCRDADRCVLDDDCISLYDFDEFSCDMIGKKYNCDMREDCVEFNGECFDMEIFDELPCSNATNRSTCDELSDDCFYYNSICHLGGNYTDLECDQRKRGDCRDSIYECRWTNASACIEIEESQEIVCQTVSDSRDCNALDHCTFENGVCHEGSTIHDLPCVVFDRISCTEQERCIHHPVTGCHDFSYDMSCDGFKSTECGRLNNCFHYSQECREGNSPNDLTCEDLKKTDCKMTERCKYYDAHATCYDASTTIVATCIESEIKSDCTVLTDQGLECEWISATSECLLNNSWESSVDCATLTNRVSCDAADESCVYVGGVCLVANWYDDIDCDILARPFCKAATHCKWDKTNETCEDLELS